MTPKRRQGGAPSWDPNLWKIRPALILTFTGAVLVSASVFYTLTAVLGVERIDQATTLDASTLFELVKLSFGVVAGAGALVALIVAYRRQRLDEAGAHREATRLHSERFTQAVEQLGSDSPAVRLGGVHALAGLADDAPDDSLRQTCIDVLCAYLRLPIASDNPASEEEHHRYLALRTVRHTILRLIGEHYRLPRGTPRSWQGHDLDLTDTTIDGPLDFAHATFCRGTVNFSRAVFSTGTVNFAHATFSVGTVNFSRVVFSADTVSFAHATFLAGTVNFNNTSFNVTAADFSNASFLGAKVGFNSASFNAYVTFRDASFSGGEVDFGYTSFSGGSLTFGNASFSGSTVSFGFASFSVRTLDFSEASFSGGTVILIADSFSPDCAVLFQQASVTGGTLRCGTVDGQVPPGLRDAVRAVSPDAWPDPPF
ncbi:pentapeptide repeat-containing protein [Streptomyces albidoflavus]|uniref:pentapeptide repeat-containing protein n=1 Tax=Streptomyces albidoflavus TaxID=1886 RepID=UPI0033EAEFD8